MNNDLQEFQNAYQLHRQGRLIEAAGIYEKLIRRNPRNYDALHLLGTIKATQGKYTDAKKLLERSLASKNNRIGYAENFATILFLSQNYEQAAMLCNTTINEAGRTETLQYILAISLYKQKRFKEAIDEFDTLLSAYPHHLAGNNEKASALAELERYEEALLHIEAALKINPAYAEALLNKGNVLGKLQKFDDSILAYGQALKLNPNIPDLHLGLGNVLRDLKRFEEASAAYDNALALMPDMASAWLGRGNAFAEFKRHDEAFAAYDKALTLDPDLAEAWLARGNLLAELKRFDEALAACEAALAITPDLAAALLLRGNIHFENNSIDQALADYERALEVKKDFFVAKAAWCLAELQITYENEVDILSRRSNFQEKLKALREEVEADNSSGNYQDLFRARLPFYLAYQGYNDRELQQIYGSMARYIMERISPNAQVLRLAEPDEKIKIGFVSAFFCNHSNWKIPIKGWLSQLNRNRFKVFGYHVGKNRDSETDIAAKMCDRFVQRAMTVNDWRREILADAPHILIYPGLFMDDVSLQLAAQRLAPVQCNSWGHPDTSGMATLDYYLSSDLMEPPNAAEHYTEELVRLPNLSIYYEAADAEPLATSRAEFGLPQNALVFWCGQSLYKYLPQYDDVFPRISEAVKSCKFVFIRHPGAEQITKIFQARLERAFASKDQNAAEHCVMLPLLKPSQFVSAIGCCDIFLDSIGWSGCNSTLESLPHNLPIVTMRGSLMRGLHTSAILSMMDVSETITNDVDEYVSTAIRLAQNADERAALSRRISANKSRIYRDRECIAGLEKFLDHVGRRAPELKHQKI
jgi:protein O-GlcNAc transferase